MRYDTPIYFCRRTAGAYDPDTGNYAADSIAEIKRYANIQNTDNDTLTLLYGALKQGVKTVTIQRIYAAQFDEIRIGTKYYRVDQTTFLRTKEIFVISEVSDVNQLEGNGSASESNAGQVEA